MKEGGDWCTRGGVGLPEVPVPHRAVSRPRHQPCTRELEAADASGVALEVDGGTGGGGAEVPELHGVVVGAREEDGAVRLQAADALLMPHQVAHDLPSLEIPHLQ